MTAKRGELKSGPYPRQRGCPNLPESHTIGGMEREVIITGIGGQGIQLMAKVLAQAAHDEGRNVMLFGIYMGMMRGGPSDSTIRFSTRWRPISRGNSPAAASASPPGRRAK